MRVYYTPSTLAASKGTVMICHHGAGFSGLSFACFAKEVKTICGGECGVLSLDAREHGTLDVRFNEQRMVLTEAYSRENTHSCSFR